MYDNDYPQYGTYGVISMKLSSIFFFDNNDMRYETTMLLFNLTDVHMYACLLS